VAVLRAPEEFPTPAFRLVCGWAAGSIAVGLAVWLQEPSREWELALACVAFFGAAIPLLFGQTMRRLVVASLAVAALVAIVALFA
jgi:Mn2+/Fe2+ NRAMP family transporter